MCDFQLRKKKEKKVNRSVYIHFDLGEIKSHWSLSNTVVEYALRASADSSRLL